MEISEETQKRLKSLFDSQLNAALATSKDGKPYCCLVSFFVTDDFRYLLFATKRARLKYEQMDANPSVALLIENTKNQPDDVTEAISVSVIGTAEDIEEPNKSVYADRLAERHPKLRQFVHSEDTAIMRVVIEKMYVVTNFESVDVVEP
ncbi:MAG: pyridoxamine 5'-phosphate oxidase family protein [Candidatus Lokiarchaeota archaeon]|nr:pyridoxamine 5'-phosphate oxidase family protein [Candidatus Lokiarchaeota archaeon]